MSRYSLPYQEFLNRLTEVEVLRRNASLLERADAINKRNDINAMCRGSIVLLSSHVEAYIKELGEHALERLVSKAVCRSKIDPQFFYHISKDIFDEIKNTEQATGIAKKVFRFVDLDAPHWSKQDHFPAQLDSQRFNKGFSNPKFKKIAAYIHRFGFKTYEHELKSKLQQNAQTTINAMDQLVATRNLIAHGDPSATRTPQEIRNILETTKIFCRTTDDVVCSWFKSELCTLR